MGQFGWVSSSSGGIESTNDDHGLSSTCSIKDAFSVYTTEHESIDNEAHPKLIQEFEAEMEDTQSTNQDNNMHEKNEFVQRDSYEQVADEYVVPLTLVIMVLYYVWGVVVWHWSLNKASRLFLS